MKGEKIGIGVIGCGAVARGFHLPAVQRNPRVTLRAVADVDETALSRTKSAVLVFVLWGVWVAGKVAWYTYTARA